jgi:hypothetical protein
MAIASCADLVTDMKRDAHSLLSVKGLAASGRFEKPRMAIEVYYLVKDEKFVLLLTIDPSARTNSNIEMLLIVLTSSFTIGNIAVVRWCIASFIIFL